MALYQVEVDGGLYEIEGPDDREPTEAEVRGLLGAETPTAAALEPQNQKSNTQGFIEHFAPTALLKGGLDTVKEVFDSSQYKGVLDNPIVRNIPLAPLPGASYNSLVAGKQSVDKAADEFAKGNYARGAVDFAKPFTPLAGSAEAAVDLYEGKPGAGGEVAGEFANLALAGLGKLGAAKGAKFAPALEESAANRWVSGMNPKAAVSGLAEKIAPEALRRNIGGTETGMRALVERDLPNAYQSLDDAWQNSPISEFDSTPIKQALQQEIQSRQFGPNKIAASSSAESAIKALQDRLDRLNAIEQEGSVPKNELRALRQQWDQDVNWLREAKRYGNSLTPEQTFSAEASKTASDAARNHISKLDPNIAKANSDVSFLKNLEAVLDNRKQPSSKLATMLGGMAGLTGEGAGVGKVGTLATVARLGHALIHTPAWKTLTAVQQAKIARALLGSVEAKPADGPRQTPGDVYEGSYPADIALREAQTNAQPLGAMEFQPLAEAAAFEETPFARAQRMGQKGYPAEVWNEPTGPIIEPSIGLEPTSGLYDIFNAPAEQPFNLPSAQQPTWQTSFGKSSRLAQPLETPTLPASILEEALINELLSQLKNER